MDSSGGAAYSPFPSFRKWDKSDVSFRDVDSAASRFAALRGTASQEDLDLALETARRTAAVDTNAIEGVFTTDRGFTRIVATKASGWKQLMSSKGDHALPSFEDTLAGIELVLDHTTAQRPVTETFVRKLHETMLVKSPKKAQAAWPVLICRRSDDEADFDLVAVTGSGRSLGVYFREVMPTVSESFRQRPGFFANAVVEEFLSEVAESIRWQN